VVTPVVLDQAQRRRKHLTLAALCRRRRGFPLENIAADISSIGKDNLGKSTCWPPFPACIMGKQWFLPVLASDAGFGAVDFQQ
jgi:hypothetical protein